MIERAVDAAVLGWGMDVVDVASPGGRAAVLSAERGATVLGLQPDEAAVEAAAAATDGVAVDWQAGGLALVPAESMDRVLAVGPPVEAAEVLRVLRPGGMFVVAADGDEAAIRSAYGPWGVQLEVEPAGAGLLAVGRRAR